MSPRGGGGGYRRTKASEEKATAKWDVSRLLTRSFVAPADDATAMARPLPAPQQGSWGGGTRVLVILG